MSSPGFRRWTRRAAGAFVTLSALWTPVLAFAAEEGHGNHFDPWLEFSRVLNFVILFLLLWFALKNPVRKAMGDRRQAIDRAIREAERAQAEARRLREEYEKRTADLEAELAELRKQSEADQAALRARLLREGQETADRVVEHARFTIEQETKKAEQQIRARAAALSLDLAEKALERELGPEDQRRFVQDYLRQVGEVN